MLVVGVNDIDFLIFLCLTQNSNRHCTVVQRCDIEGATPALCSKLIELKVCFRDAWQRFIWGDMPGGRVHAHRLFLTCDISACDFSHLLLREDQLLTIQHREPWEML